MKNLFTLFFVLVVVGAILCYNKYLKFKQECQEEISRHIADKARAEVIHREHTNERIKQLEHSHESILDSVRREHATSQEEQFKEQDKCNTNLKQQVDYLQQELYTHKNLIGMPIEIEKVEKLKIGNNNNNNYNDNSILCFYINLDRSVDRKVQMEKQFQKYRFSNTKRISAIDGAKELSGSTTQGSFSRNGKKFQFINSLGNAAGPTLSAGEIGCTLSHLVGIWTAYYHYPDQDIAMLTEDDLSLDLIPLWTQSLQDIYVNAPKDWNILQLHSLNGPISAVQPYRKYDKNEGTACYLINRKGMKSLLDKCFVSQENMFRIENSPYGVADWFLYQGEGVYTYTIPLFFTLNHHHTMQSTISGDLNKYHVNRNIQLVAYYTEPICFYVIKQQQHQLEEDDKFKQYLDSTFPNAPIRQTSTIPTMPYSSSSASKFPNPKCLIVVPSLTLLTQELVDNYQSQNLFMIVLVDKNYNDQLNISYSSDFCCFLNLSDSKIVSGGPFPQFLKGPNVLASC